MVEGITGRGGIGNTWICVMRSEPGLSDSKNVYCFGYYKISERGGFSRIERMLLVARRMLCLITGPGLRLISPASRSIKTNVNVGLELGIGSNFRLKHRLRYGRLCKLVKDSCVVMYLEGVGITSDHCASVLHKVKSWLLEGAEQDEKIKHTVSTMVTFDKICSSDKINVS